MLNKLIFIIKRPAMINRRKMRIKSSHCGPYGLGYTRATMKIYKKLLESFDIKKFLLIFKSFLCSNCKLKLVYMKLESLVIANQNVAVNMYLSLVHTARHMQRVSFI